MADNTHASPDAWAGAAVRRACSLAVLSMAAVCAVAYVDTARDGRRQAELLSWLNAHYDSQFGYSGLRTTVPADVVYKTPWSATPLGIPREGVAVAPFPMPYAGGIHRAQPKVVMSRPAIRQTTTTTFSDSPNAPVMAAAPAALKPVGAQMPEYAASGWSSPSSTYSASAFSPAGELAESTVPSFMHPQFLGTLSMGAFSGGPNAGYMPGPAFDMRTTARLQRGFVPVRVAIPRAALPGLPRFTRPLFQSVAGPQMAYDANNINSGLVEGFNDINPRLGLPSVPPGTQRPAAEMKDTGARVDVSTGARSDSIVGGASIALPAGKATPLCNTELILLEQDQAGTGEEAPCEPLQDAKKTLGASAYAAIEVITAIPLQPTRSLVRPCSSRS